VAETNFLTRKAESRDAAELLRLGIQLGYLNELKDVRERLQALLANPSHTIQVVEDSRDATKLLGFIHLKVHGSLLVDEQVEVAALVVDEDVRGTGIGKHFMRLAEEWTLKQGLKKIRLTSNVSRTDAHRFYLNAGYQQPKTSHFFQKSL
jgi:GNAT superfamily N-acetyltransferase